VVIVVCLFQSIEYFLRNVWHVFGDLYSIEMFFCPEESGICDLIFALLCSVLLVQDYISFWSALAVHSSVCASIAIVPLKM